MRLSLLLPLTVCSVFVSSVLGQESLPPQMHETLLFPSSGDGCSGVGGVRNCTQCVYNCGRAIVACSFYCLRPAIFGQEKCKVRLSIMGESSQCAYVLINCCM